MTASGDVRGWQPSRATHRWRLFAVAMGVIVAGIGVAIGAGIAAMRWLPHGTYPGCVARGSCTPEQLDAALQRWQNVGAAGLVAVAVGAVLHIIALASRVPPAERTEPSLTHRILVGLAVSVVFAPLALTLVTVVIVNSQPMWLSLVAGEVLVLAWVLVLMAGYRSHRPRWTMALAYAGSSVAVMGALWPLFNNQMLMPLLARLGVDVSNQTWLIVVFTGLLTVALLPTVVGVAALSRTSRRPVPALDLADEEGLDKELAAAPRRGSPLMASESDDAADDIDTSITYAPVVAEEPSRWGDEDTRVWRDREDDPAPRSGQVPQWSDTAGSAPAADTTSWSSQQASDDEWRTSEVSREARREPALSDTWTSPAASWSEPDTGRGGQEPDSWSVPAESPPVWERPSLPEPTLPSQGQEWSSGDTETIDLPWTSRQDPAGTDWASTTGGGRRGGGLAQDDDDTRNRLRLHEDPPGWVPRRDPEEQDPPPRPRRGI